MATASQVIADFVARTEYVDLPRRVAEKAKLGILDCVGVALAGTGDETSRVVREYVEEMGGKEEGTVIGSRRRVPLANAALVNGVAAHALDYDDTSFEMLGHPSAVTLPAALGAGEVAHASGKEVVTAYVLGVEVGCRLGKVLTEATYAAGWHNTGILGTFAATVAAGKLLRLDEAQMAHAIGAAASMTAGIKANFGTSMKPYHAGQACSNGVKAAILAKRGFTSSLHAIEGKGGFARLSSGKSFRLKEFKLGLGRTYSIDRPGFAYKLYPSCAYTHGAIDAAIKLRRAHPKISEDAESIECRAGPGAIDAVPYGIPKNVLEAKFSMPYCVAVALTDGNAMLPQFTEERLSDSRLRALMRKVAFHKDENVAKGYGDRAVAVSVSLRNGKLLKCRVSKPQGDPSNPISFSELVGKYRSCASQVLSGRKVAVPEQAIMSLEKMEDVSELLRALAP